MSTDDGDRSESGLYAPACTCRGYGPEKWYVFDYTDAHGDFYRPCQHDECYPDGPPEVGTTVARARSHPTVFHRWIEQPEQPDKPEKPDKPEQPEHPAAAGRGPTERGELYNPVVPDDGGREVVELSSLSVGSRIRWPEVVLPLRVVEVSESHVRAVGPSGGETTIEANECRRPEPFRARQSYIESLTEYDDDEIHPSRNASFASEP